MSLQVLSDSMKSHIRSGVAITSLVQCVEELVMNSIDANGLCIVVQVDIPHLMIQVTDNGEGITCEDLQVMGTRYATSKCHRLSDLNHLSCYGYRGEALASLVDICGVMEIVTRHRLSSKTYYKAIHYGNVLPVKENAGHRSSVGTTITLHDIFYSLPVRRKAVYESKDIERIRQAIISIALIHPGISLSLHNIQSTKPLLQIPNANSLVKRFAQLFGNELSHGLREVSGSNMGFSVSGYISLQGHHTKSLQFLYVNGRLVKKTKLHSQINNILANSLICRKSSAFSSRPSNSLTNPQSCSDKDGIYILTIKCSYSEYDICLEPAKTMVEFKRWDDICSVVEMTVTQFLSDHHLYLGLSNMSKKRLASTIVDDSDQTKYGVHSRPAKRVTQTLTSDTGDSTSINILTKYNQNEPSTGKSFISLNTPIQTPLPCFIKQSDVPGASLCSISSTSSSSLNYRRSPGTLQSKITTRILKQFSSTNKSAVRCTYDHPMITNHLPLTTSSHHHGLSLCKPADSFITTFAGNSTPSNEMMPSKETTGTSDLLGNQTDITSTVDNSFISENTTRDIITNAPVSDCSILYRAGDTTNIDDVPDNPMWRTVKDIVTGAPIYVHRATGNTQSTKPIELSQTKNDVDQSYGQCTLKSGPHLSYGYSSLLPRPKHMRVYHETSVSSLTKDSLNNEERTVKWRESKEVSSLFSHWSNPAFTGGDNDVLNIGPSQNIRVHNVLHSYKFTCDMLTDLKILGQVDNKFIACLMRFEANRSLLVFFDQHAVHERIRLEALTEGAYEYNDSGDKKIKSMSVYPPIILSLSPSERKLARTFSTQLKNIGVQLKHENDHVIVTALPSVIMEKDMSVIKQCHPTVTTSLIHELIVNYLESIVRGHCIMPSTIQHILNSKACHGAIKFGDSLCLKECSDLILSLSKCKLPFQCAHGRPSLVPILDLELLEKRFPSHKIKNYRRINFSKLKHSI